MTLNQLAIVPKNMIISHETLMALTIP